MIKMKTIKKTGIEFMYDLYKATAKKKCKPIVVCPELYPYVKQLYKLYEQPLDLISKKGKLIPKRKKKNNKAIVAVSGGKDSLATLFDTINKFGDKVECFHVMNINRLYPKEKENVMKIARHLNLKLNKINFPIFKTWLPESIIKNQMIYALILEKYPYLPKAIGFGGTNDIGPQSMAFFHDSRKAFKLFHEFAKKSWGNHALIPFLKDEIQAYKIIYKHCPPELRSMTVSCMTEYQYKRRIQTWLVRKFGVILPNPYDCGACYKCAEKVLVENKLFGIQYPKKYLKYCRELIRDKVDNTIKMNGYPTKYLKNLNII